MRIRYRLSQFWRTISPQKLTYDEGLKVKKNLSYSEWELFKRFTSGDQRHSYRVFQTLQSNGYCQPELLAAALLHDIGKTKVPLSVWERSLIVICEAIIPKQADYWGKEKGKRWLKPFVVRAQHPDWGADMAKAAGSKTMVVNLIRRHQDLPPQSVGCLEDEFLTLLQWADDQN